ncbi:MAG TPA: hypothetical protein VG246_06030 [Acidimicrobiales bacterium]|jgi:hypothetical protein|nr:hypothetical protein [Acidimicrobiales bacterium]
MDQSDHVIAHFVYRSIPSSKRHGVSIMLVARLQGSNVVARVNPLGRGPKEPAASRARGGLDVLGPWTTTASRRYAKARVALRPT